MTDIIVVGAGASGMAAAIMAARSGASVLMLEHMDSPGKKILATGNGRCNYTNSLQTQDCYRGSDPSFAFHILSQFDQERTVSFFQELGIYPKIKNGYYYPFSQQAVSVRDALLLELKRLHVEIITGIGIRKILYSKDHFIYETKTGTYESRCCILACGGKASKKTGSDGSGLIYARSFGHHIIPLLPALVQMTAKESFYKELAGIRADAMFSLYCEDILLIQDQGEVQLTDYGLSGIPAFQVSRFAATALDQGKYVHACLDFLPESSFEEVEQMLSVRFQECPDQRSAIESLNGLFNQKLSQLLLTQSGIDSNTSAIQVAAKKVRRLASMIKQFRTDITGTKNFDSAQTSCGGIDTNELTIEMESTLQPGLYFAGEMVDIDGKCGGYNLQWAWSSGAVAGTHAAAALLEKERTN